MLIAIIYFGGGLAFAMALAQFFQPPGKTDRLRAGILVLLFVCVGVLLCHSTFLFSGMLRKYPHLMMSQVPFLLFLGPLMHLYILGILEEDFQVNRRFYLHFIPGVLVTVFMLPFYLEPAEAKLLAFQNFLEGKFSLPARMLFMLFNVHLLGYMLALGFRHRFLLRPEYLRQSKYQAASLIIIVSVTATLLGSVAWATQQLIYVKYANGMVSLLILMVYLMSQRYPELLQSLARETLKNNYKRSKIEKLDLDGLREQLTEIMDNDSLYCDEDLSLQSLAAYLDITPHQLSQFLNQHMGKNFNAYLNDYRLRAACKLLVEESERTTLSVAMAVGFSSSSVFHSVFRKAKGMTPGQYRKSHSKVKR